MTASELRRAQERYLARVRDAKTERDAKILRAIAEGWTHSRIAEATGLTRGRIGQIATDR